MIKLVPMTELEFEMYLQYNIQEYAHEYAQDLARENGQDLAQSGRELEDEGVHDAEKQYHLLLPQGLQTPGHSLFMIRDEEQNKNVGVLWFDRREQQLFVNDIVIFEEFRRRGYARQTMQYLEKHAAELGATSISLRVLGHNEAARNLYEKLDYAVEHINMSKSL